MPSLVLSNSAIVVVPPEISKLPVSIKVLPIVVVPIPAKLSSIL